MIKCNVCQQLKTENNYTTTTHGIKGGKIDFHSRCKPCDNSRRRLQGGAALAKGYKGGRSDKEWTKLSRAERADITSNFMEYLRSNYDPILEKLDADYCRAQGFFGTSHGRLIQSQTPKPARRKKKSNGPTLKAMPRSAASKTNTVDTRLIAIREKHQSELSGTNNEQVTMREGFVYVLANPAWPNALKIGSALDYESRLKQYQTGDPTRSYELVYTIYCDNRKLTENKVHHMIIDSRMTGEWFNITPDDAIAAIEAALSSIDLSSSN